MLDTLPPSASLSALLAALESAHLGFTVILSHPDRLERVYANEAIAKIWGVDIETMRRLPPLESLTAEQRARLTLMRQAIREGGPVPPLVETTVVRGDGTSVPVELGLGHTMIGDTRAIFVFARDMSAKAEMQTALRESEDRFRRLAEASPDSITVFSEGKYTYANPIALGHLGLPSVADLAAIDPESQIPDERRVEVHDHVARLRRGEKLPPLVHRRRNADGSESFLEASLSFVTFDGHPAIVSWARDITDRVRLQAELMKQDRLASLGLLAAGVAHELNNPLASLSMQARKLRDEADDRGLPADVKIGLEQINEAAKRMTAIIADLLFMARPVEQPQAHVDVNRILLSTVALLRAGITACPPLNLDVQELPPVHGYASKLGQVFLNVLRNAVQAVEGVPGGEIRLQARVVGERIEIVTEDNGVGMPPEVLAHVAQPFFTTKPQGAGLGLWISQTLLERQGGTLTLTSRVGVGTVVTISLPA
jgi:PAS domain S-box-containing protein